MSAIVALSCDKCKKPLDHIRVREVEIRTVPDIVRVDDQRLAPVVSQSGQPILEVARPSMARAQM